MRGRKRDLDENRIEKEANRYGLLRRKTTKSDPPDHTSRTTNNHSILLDQQSSRHNPLCQLIASLKAAVQSWTKRIHSNLPAAWRSTRNTFHSRFVRCGYPQRVSVGGASASIASSCSSEAESCKSV